MRAACSSVDDDDEGSSGNGVTIAVGSVKGVATVVRSREEPNGQ